MFAQVALDNQYLLGWGLVLTLSVLTSLALNITNLIRLSARQKREVSFSEAYVTTSAYEARCEAMDQRVHRIENSLSSAWETMRREDETTRDEIRRGMQALQRDIGRMEGKVDSILRQINGSAS